MRLINADDICNCLDRIDDEKNKLWYNFLRNVVQGVPAEDAELVRHGYWIYTPADTDTTTKARFKCSECGRMRNMFVRYQHKYCAECGAKMDGGKK